MTAPVTEKHRELAQEVVCPGSKYNTPEEAILSRRVAQAIACSTRRSVVSTVNAAMERDR